MRVTKGKTGEFLAFNPSHGERKKEGDIILPKRKIEGKEAEGPHLTP